MFLFAERIGADVFISRRRFEGVDEGQVCRGGTDAHPVQFIGGAFARCGPDADSAVVEIGDGQGCVFMGTGRHTDF